MEARMRASIAFHDALIAGGSMAGDPFIAAAREALTVTLGDLRPAIEGASTDALNWHPAAADTNSIAVLAVHSMASTRSWLSVALGAPLPDRDRDSEFRTAAAGADDLLTHIADMERECLALLDAAKDVDWSARRRTHPRPRPGAEQEVNAAWALLHALEHLREHAGQITLTRQLFDQRQASG
jgi:uncharacterized damage-inducible protein DinB